MSLPKSVAEHKGGSSQATAISSGVEHDRDRAVVDELDRHAGELPVGTP